jgi:hypothetical protein
MAPGTVSRDPRLNIAGDGDIFTVRATTIFLADFIGFPDPSPQLDR